MPVRTMSIDRGRERLRSTVSDSFGGSLVSSLSSRASRRAASASFDATTVCRTLVADALEARTITAEHPRTPAQHAWLPCPVGGTFAAMTSGRTRRDHSSINAPVEGKTGLVTPNESEPRTVEANGISLAYQSFGDPKDRPLLLVMGLATQMLGWHDEFCGLLVDEGFYVVRFDNRDIGLSTHLPEAGMPDLRRLFTEPRSVAAYTLEDMADDTAGLLDALGIGAADVVGASMGGMIAQVLAARHPERVRSLTSIMSTTGSRWRGQPHFRVYSAFLAKPPADREAYIERAQKLFKLVGGSGFGDISEEVAESAAQQYDRGINTGGTGRQLGAILA